MMKVPIPSRVLCLAKETYFSKFYVDSPYLLTPTTTPKFSSFSALEQFLSESNKGTGGGGVSQLYNVVKVCSNCHKPCAASTTHCNNCGETLPTETTKTPNIFTAFLYSTKPYSISLRFLSPTHNKSSDSTKTMIFDDTLSLGLCHLNAVPTDIYIPHFVALFVKPVEGRKILEDLLANLKQTFFEQFVPKLKENFDLDVSEDNYEKFLERNVLIGLNFPPSQKQLHVQFILLPVMPIQYRYYTQGKHATHMRFFPITYLLNALQLEVAYNPDFKIENQGKVKESSDGNANEEIKSEEEAVDIEHFVAFYDKLLKEKAKSKRGFCCGKGSEKLKVDYNSVWKAEYEKIATVQAEQGSIFYKDEAFSGVIEFSSSGSGEDEEKAVVKIEGEETDLNWKEVVEDDKKVMQNYGRPYNADKKPTGTYVDFGKETSLNEF